MTTDKIFNQSPQVKGFELKDRPIYLYNSLQINQILSQQRVNTIEYLQLNSLKQLSKIDNDEKYKEIIGKF